jgi:hypothetical protein
MLLTSGGVGAMNGMGMYATWLAGPVLQITLLFFMVRRKLHGVFPRFFTYIIYQIVKSAILFGVYRLYPDNYFDAYWAGNAISVLLGIVVMDEILQHLLKQYGGIQKSASVIFRWACGLLLLLSVVNAFSTEQTNADRVVSAVLSFDRSERLMQCGLCILLLVLCRLLKNCWRQHVFGIALGFGIFASIELVLVSVVMHFGDGAAATISLMKSSAYNAVTLLWIVYLRRQTESTLEIEDAQELSALNAVLIRSPEVGEIGFISMVEQMVDHVLSRSTWPRPAVQGSQITGRKPDRDENN